MCVKFLQVQSNSGEMCSLEAGSAGNFDGSLPPGGWPAVHLFTTLELAAVPGVQVLMPEKVFHKVYYYSFYEFDKSVLSQN